MASHNHAVITRTLMPSVLARLAVARVAHGRAGVLGHLRNRVRVETASAQYAIGILRVNAGGTPQGRSEGGKGDKAKHVVR